MKPLISVLFLFLIFSCQHENLTTPNQTFNYDQIGIEHNKGLDYVFESLKKQKQDGINPDELKTYLNIVESSSEEYINGSSYNVSAEQKVIIKKGISNKSQAIKNYSTARIKSSDYIYNQILGDTDSLLIDNQRSSIKEILTVVVDQNLELEETLAQLSTIEKNASDKFDESELPVILSVISVAKYSVTYWNENGDKWAQEFGALSTNGRVKQKINWGWVGGTDVASAVSMGIACTPAVAGGPVGWGFATLAIGGAALVGSGGAALVQLL